MPKYHHLDARAEQLAEAGAGAGDEFISTKELAAWVRMSPQWVELGRTKGYGPRFVRIGPKRVRYRRSDVLEWLASRTYASTAQYAEG